MYTFDINNPPYCTAWSCIGEFYSYWAISNCFYWCQFQTRGGWNCPRRDHEKYDLLVCQPHANASEEVMCHDSMFCNCNALCVACSQFTFDQSNFMWVEFTVRVRVKESRQEGFFNVISLNDYGCSPRSSSQVCHLSICLDEAKLPKGKRRFISKKALFHIVSPGERQIPWWGKIFCWDDKAPGN